jgi:hypothetical protein
MINLLPTIAKKRLLGNYWSRVVVTWMVVWSIALIISMVLILPTSVLIGSQILKDDESMQQVEENVLGFEAVAAEITRANLLAVFISNESRTIKMSEYINFFRSVEREGVYLNGIDLTREGLEVKRAIVSGVAENRQALSSLRDTLLASEYVEEVDLPISNLAQDKDIPFSLDISITPFSSVKSEYE